MLKKLRNILHPSSNEAGGEDKAIAPEQLRLFAGHFRIGQKILYFPEYHQKSVLNTIIVAYRVNGEYLYSNDALRFTPDSALQGFRISSNKALPLDEVLNFQVLLPDTSELERKLDYFTRAELGPAGHLRQGNTITLVCDSAERCVPTIDAIVQRKQVMTEGPFEGSSTILVTPDFASLKINDKRRQQRVHTAIWADMFYAPGSPPFPCMLKDFSESSLRLGTGEANGCMPELEAGKVATVEFDFGSIATTYRIRGRVIRRDATNCVLQMEQIYKDGEFDRIKLIDTVEIKTRLLNLDYDPKSL
jgi:hypothetical protein